jgi:hypothetical protein
MIRTRLFAKVFAVAGAVGLAAAAMSFAPARSAHADSAPIFKPDLQLVPHSFNQVGPIVVYYMRLTNNGTGYANNTKLQGYCWSNNFGLPVVAQVGTFAPGESRLVALTCMKYPDNYGQVNHGLTARALTQYELDMSDNVAMLGKAHLPLGGW